MGLLRWINARRAEKKADHEAIAKAAQEFARAGDELSEEQLDATADRAGAVFPNS